MKGEEHSDLSARDLAKLGLLMLADGIFDGKRIVSGAYAIEP
ncbi:hypothetical protein [Paenibacillus cellulosilyticus]|nr:hypothetical protein [Paenibacillus cellulosilyticus]